MNGTMEQRWLRIFFAPDGDAGGGGGDPGGPAEPGADSQTSSGDTSSQPPGQGQRGAAPWDARLAELELTDPRFSEYLRTDIQPRMTQLEQQLAQYGQMFPQDITKQFAGGAQEAAQAAAGILAGLNSDPVGTIQQLVQLLEIDPSALQQLQEAAGNDPDAQAALEVAEEQVSGQEGQGELPPEIQWAREQMQVQVEQAQDAQFQSHLSQLGQQIPGLDAQKYTYALILNQGDDAAALDMYMKEFHNPATTAAPPSPTLGQAAGVAPNDSPQPTSIKGAVSDFMSEDRLARNAR